jgi:hypothetical protein
MKLRATVILSTFLFSAAPAFAQDTTPDSTQGALSGSNQDSATESTAASTQSSSISIKLVNYDDQSLLVKVFDQLANGKQVYSSTLDQGSSDSTTIAIDNNGRGYISWQALQTVRDDGAGSLKCAVKTVGAVDSGQNLDVRIDYGKPCK